MKLKFLLSAILCALTSTLWSQSSFKGISNAGDYICAHDGSKVNCWGINEYGQIQEIDGFSHIKELKTTRSFVCAADDVGISCWGLAPELPIEMLTASGLSKLELAQESVCMLLDGRISCVGTHEAAPAQLTHVSDFSISNRRSCAIQDGQVYCWGNGFHEIPSDLGYAVKIDISEDFACVLNQKNVLRCWGDVTLGTLSPPQQYRNIVDFQIGYYHGCLVNELKEVSCWGSIWDGLDQVPKGDNFSQLSVSTISNCVLDTAGKVICWGFGSKNLKQPPVIKRPTYFAQTNSGTCFVMNDQIFCAGSEDLSLGRNVKGIKYLTGRYHSLCLIDELGPLCVTHNPFLQMPQGSQNATQLSIGADHLCGILDEGKVECWGERPLEMDSTVTGLRGVKKITSGYRHSCALTDKNVLRCWGVDAVNPNFSSDQKVVDIASGSNFSCALLENDAIKCWMLEGYEDRDIVHPPAFVIDAKGLISGDQFACVYSDSEINCWGSKNDDIQLPPKVAGKIKSISAGNSHACFEDEEKIKCWGSNRQGNYLFFQE